MRNRLNPYTALQREVQQFVANIWHRRKTALFTVTLSEHARGQLDAAEILGNSLVITRRGAEITVHAVKKISAWDVPCAVRPDHIEGAL